MLRSTFFPYDEEYSGPTVPFVVDDDVEVRQEEPIFIGDEQVYRPKNEPLVIPRFDPISSQDPPESGEQEFELLLRDPIESVRPKDPYVEGPEYPPQFSLLLKMETNDSLNIHCKKPSSRLSAAGLSWSLTEPDGWCAVLSDSIRGNDRVLSRLATAAMVTEKEVQAFLIRLMYYPEFADPIFDGHVGKIPVFFHKAYMAEVQLSSRVRFFSLREKRILYFMLGGMSFIDFLMRPLEQVDFPEFCAISVLHFFRNRCVSYVAQDHPVDTVSAVIHSFLKDPRVLLSSLVIDYPIVNFLLCLMMCVPVLNHSHWLVQRLVGTPVGPEFQVGDIFGAHFPLQCYLQVCDILNVTLDGQTLSFDNGKHMLTTTKLFSVNRTMMEIVTDFSQNYIYFLFSHDEGSHLAIVDDGVLFWLTDSLDLFKEIRFPLSGDDLFSVVIDNNGEDDKLLVRFPEEVQGFRVFTNFFVPLPCSFSIFPSFCTSSLATELFEIVLCVTFKFSSDIATAFLDGSGITESAEIEVVSPLIVEPVNSLQTRFDSGYFSVTARTVHPVDCYYSRIIPSLNCVVYPLTYFFSNFMKSAFVKFYFVTSSHEEIFNEDSWYEAGTLTFAAGHYFNTSPNNFCVVYGMNPSSSIFFGPRIVQLDSLFNVRQALSQELVVEADPEDRFRDENDEEETLQERMERLGIDFDDSGDEEGNNNDPVVNVPLAVDFSAFDQNVSAELLLSFLDASH